MLKLSNLDGVCFLNECEMCSVLVLWTLCMALCKLQRALEQH